MTRTAHSILALAAAAALAAPQTASAQSAKTSDDARPTAAPDADAPVAVTPDDYGKWENLGFPTLSDDGRWLAYGINRVNDENELRIRRLDGDSTIVIDYGGQPEFSEDGRWLAYSIGMSEDEREKLQKQNKPVRSKLGLLNGETGDTTIVDAVASFAFGDDGAYLAMRRYPPKSNGDDAGSADLVVRDMATGVDTRLGDVGEFAWQDDGGLLALVIDAEDDAANGVQLYDPRTERLRTLVSEEAEFTGLAWRPASDDLAVLRARTDSAYEDTTHAVLAWRGLAGGEPERLRFEPDADNGFPAEMRIVDVRDLRWAEDGASLFFGIKERERKDDEAGPSAEADSADGEGGNESRPDSASAEGDNDDEDPAQVLVWHPDDVEIIPTQKVRAERDRRRNYLSVWHLDDDRFVRLGEERFDGVTVLEGDRYAVSRDREPYRRDRMFGPDFADIALIDVETGERRTVVERVQYFFGPSTGGRYLLYLEDDDYWTYDIEADRRTNITEGLPTSFVDLDDDHTVEQKPPFGRAGWTEGDRDVLLYDEYDIWRVRPDGSDAERLTNGAADSVQHRYMDLVQEEEPDDDFIDPDEPLYLNLYDDWTEEHGYARMEMGDEPERLVWEARSLGWLQKAEDADVYLYRMSDFDDSPDYFVAGADLSDAVQVTRTNPFQDDYAWGRSELVEYENARGEKLQGALFYPANYDPDETYPMITYIYEIRSYAVRSYYTPSEDNPYNPAVWTAEGYFVFQPDITYRPRNPGLSAIESIVPAVETVLETGMIDPDRVGLVGHSWGGYQTAFSVTQTDIFRTAVAGAPLTNLVSMYNSIYWRTGGTDARIFEISQGRMEVPPWEDWDAYIANSPLHHVTEIETPLLVGFGDDDGAVEFNQGVEFYNAARRAGKHLVMLVYAGENHGISRREEDRRDYHRRVKTWFDHYLKGEPAPKWITEGVPYLEQMEMREEGDGGDETTT